MIRSRPDRIFQPWERRPRAGVERVPKNHLRKSTKSTTTAKTVKVLRRPWVGAADQKTSRNRGKDQGAAEN